MATGEEEATAVVAIKAEDMEAAGVTGRQPGAMDLEASRL